MFDNSNTPFCAIGGEEVVRNISSFFYKEMDSGKYPNLRNIHPNSLEASEQKFFEFLVGWLGGPQLYIQKHGHPRLRMRHAPFSIGEVEVEEWITCMNSALDRCEIDGEVRVFLDKRFMHVAKFMQNN